MVGVVEEVRGGLQVAKEDNQRLLTLNTTLQVSLSPFQSTYICIRTCTCMDPRVHLYGVCPTLPQTDSVKMQDALRKQLARNEEVRTYMYMYIHVRKHVHVYSNW